MLNRRYLLMAGVFGSVATRLSWGTNPARAAETFPVTHTDAEWHKLLSADQFEILRNQGTERPFTSELLQEERKGNFACAGCDQDAFLSSTKFDSGTGLPSFWAPIEHAVATERDTSFGMVRDAVHCTRCGGHLGHVFDDGPKPTGLRYCMNGVALKFHTVSA
jgi:peptide-methionine (R)-S-oxide reductase